jgi:hypothetical protein
MVDPPSPHPLDFDWRYNEATARGLAVGLRHRGSILAIGAPSVVRLLDEMEVHVTLVDRQPLQGVRRHLICDAAEFVTDEPYRTALVDPPWYPAQLRDWTEVAAGAVGTGGTILVSVWPETTRPAAASELATTLERFSQWADVYRDEATLRYATPRFEIIARESRESCELSRSPLTGELIRLEVRELPPVHLLNEPTEQWLRFTVDDYQLAIRCRHGDNSDRVEPLFPAEGWRWPFVSARAPGIGRIDLWSSEGEVARVGSPRRLIEMLRRALGSPDARTFERALADARALLSWRIPRPPYRRSIEWLHRQ